MKGTIPKPKTCYCNWCALGRLLRPVLKTLPKKKQDKIDTIIGHIMSDENDDEWDLMKAREELKKLKEAKP